MSMDSHVCSEQEAPAMVYNKKVEGFRDTEYPMMKEKVYLDHAGTTVYAKSLVEKFSKNMIDNLYGNPHSASTPAKLSGDVVDKVRKQTLAFFNADPEHFDLVFTANATASIKLIAESFHGLAEDSSASGTFWYGYHKDSHTSLAGVRELTKGSHHCFGSDSEVEQWLCGTHSNESNSVNSAGLPGLFAYPGQSNMTGRRLPLSWSEKLRKSHVVSHQNTYSLLDAAALATTTQLDFSDHDAAPDFTAVSFYKIFGFPDLGGLIVRRASGHILLWRKYFGGGTVNALTVLHEATVQRKDASIHDSLEDGTLPFHNIMALGCALDIHKNLYGSMSAISKHTSFLIHRLCSGMKNLHHFDGTKVCTIYADNSEAYGNPLIQGATIAFNIKSSGSNLIGHSDVEKAANEGGIYLRSGGLCNAGGIAGYLQLEPWQMKRNWSAGHRCGEPGLEVLNRKPTGVVRASLGAMSTMEDVDRFLAFLVEEYVEVSPTHRFTNSTSTSCSRESLKRIDSGYISSTSSIEHSTRPFSISQQFSSFNLGDWMAADRSRLPTEHTDKYAASQACSTPEMAKLASGHQFVIPAEDLQVIVRVGAMAENLLGKTGSKRNMKQRRSFRFWKTKR